MYRFPRKVAAGASAMALMMAAVAGPASAGNSTRTWKPPGYSTCKGYGTTAGWGTATSEQEGPCSMKVNMKYLANDGSLNWIGWDYGGTIASWSSAPNVDPVQGFHGMYVPSYSTYWSTYA